MPVLMEEQCTEKIKANDMVYNILQEWIIKGVLQPREKISDLEIAKRLKVSRTPVREALIRLEGQKLVKTFPGRYTMVTEMELDNIEKWYLPMSTLQQLAATLAIRNGTEKDAKILEQINQQFGSHLEDGASLEAFEADKEFHEYVMEVAGNEYIVDFCNTLMIHIQRLEYAYFKGSENLHESVLDHKQLIDAMRLKDEYSASLAMKKNWSNTVIKLHALMDSGRL